MTPSSFLIHSRKLTAYLLDIAHKQGGSKARFFLLFGFRVDDPDILGRAILNHAVPMNFVGIVKGPRGDERFIYEGAIVSPDGRNPSIRTIWLKEADATARFITAVPLT